MSPRRPAPAYRSTLPARAAERSVERFVDIDSLSHAALLGTRLCNLGLRLQGSELEASASALLAELAQRGIRFQPHLWLSTEWFSPDGVPGIAIPFYLAHPRLQALEVKQMGEAEGGTPESFLKLLRHETGHVLDTAYRLHERADWRDAFGAWTAPYQRHYRPKPYSKKYVRYLSHLYAQSHPAEDFAETFAVWLDPESHWRTRYRGWPALQKLLYMNRLMREISQKDPLVRRREKVDHISGMTLTVRAYFEGKRRRYHHSRRAVYERDLTRLFRERGNGAALEPAASYMQRNRPEIRKLVVSQTDAFQYEIDRVLRGMIERSEELELVVPQSVTSATHTNGHARAARGAQQDPVQRIATQLVQYIEEGHHRYVR